MPIFGPGRISKGIRQDMAILLKRPEHTWHIELEDYLLYVDAGCWQGNDKGDFKSNFVLISGNGVAVCNYYPVKRSHVSVRHLHKLKNWETEFNKCKVILDFLKLIDSSNPLSHLLYFYRSISRKSINPKPFWDNDSLLIVIGDLHLHHFKETVFDNFIKVVGGKRISLEEDFCNFLDLIISYYKANQNINIKIVQAGDMFEIWELYSIIKAIDGYFRTRERNQTWFLKKFPFIEWKKQYSPMFDIDPSKYEKNMRDWIYPKIFRKLYDLKAQGITVNILQGNHDNVLGKTHTCILDSIRGRNADHKMDYNDGPEYIIHVEHGHRYDSANKPGGDLLGRLATDINVEAEDLGLGDEIKGVVDPPEKDEKALENITIRDYNTNISRVWRDDYMIEAVRENSKAGQKGKEFSAFIMAHTHIPYSAKLKVKRK